MVTAPEPPPEARLIARLREEMIPKLSMREAARRAGMSPTLWANCERGWQRVAPRVTVPWRATDERLAHMALVVGATPEQLAEAGRPAAAQILRKLSESGPDPAERLADVVRSSRDLPELAKRALLDLLARGGG